MLPTKLRCKRCGEERARQERVPASGAGKAMVSLAMAAGERQSMSAGERNRAEGARKTPREGDGRVLCGRKALGARTRKLACWSAVAECGFRRCGRSVMRDGVAAGGAERCAADDAWALLMLMDGASTVLVLLVQRRGCCRSECRCWG
jgi:hypothetical protein